MKNLNATKTPCPLAVMEKAAQEVAFSRTPADAKPIREARAKVAELVAADREYDEARRDWDYAIAAPEAYSGEEMARVANRFESAIARRAAALAAFSEDAE